MKSKEPSLEQPWYRELNRYHIWIFIVAALGWLFDTMDQRIFVLGKQRAIADLLPATAGQDEVNYWGGVATAI
ncbi:MAG TPA: MFS transporter, partial [Planctomycetota bacterium]|nr:MFS transporter [Planctomycetota bacterium]